MPDPTFEARMKDVAATLQGDATLMRLALGDDKTAPNPALALELADARVYRTKVVPQTAHVRVVWPEADRAAALQAFEQ